MEKEQYIKETLQSLQNTLENNEATAIEVEDKKLNHAIASQKREQDEEYNKRNNLYTELLENYIQIYKKKEKNKSIYKFLFFFTTMLLFSGIIIVCGYNMYNISVHGDPGGASVGIALSNVIGIVSTLIVLPKIIAEHLFPTNEENNMIGMVKNMQENDANIRDTLYKAHEENDFENSDVNPTEKKYS